MRPSRLLLFVLFLFPAIGLWPFDPSPGPNPPCRVLVLHSYHHGYYWTDSVQRGIEAAFSESETPVEVQVEYLDAKRHPGDAYLDVYAQLLARKSQRWFPDAIISMDDDALAFLFEYRDTLYPRVPVVFGGLDVDAFDSSLLAGRSGYTGVVERLDLASTVDTILTVHPGTTTILVVHDVTTSGRAHRRLVRSIATDYEDRVEIELLGNEKGLTTEELLGHLRRLTPDTVVYFLGFFRDREGTPLAPEYIVPLICDASPVPVYAHWEGVLGLGIVGGKLLSGEVHGRSVGEKTLEALLRPESELPLVSVESSNRHIFDYRQLERFGIPTRRLPGDSILRYQPASFWDRYRPRIIAGASAVGALIVAIGILVVSMVRRRRIERRLSASEQKYRLLVDQQSDMVIEVDTEGRFLFVNPRYCETFGVPEEQLRGRRFLPLVHPEDRAATEEAMKDLYHEPFACTLEQRAMTGRGWRWISWADRAVRDELGNVISIIGVGRDITERKQTENKLRSSLEEKDLLMQEINHRVKNNLVLVRSLINLKASDKHIDLSDVSNQIDAIRIVHERLHESKNVSAVFLPAYLSQVVETVLSTAGSQAIRAEVDIDEVWLPTKAAVTLGLIVNEIATNAAKHGFASGDADGTSPGRFGITLREMTPKGSSSTGEAGQSNPVLEVTLVNSGAPIPDDVDFDYPKTLGMRLIRELVQQLRGSVELIRGPNPVFTIRVPYDPSAISG